MKAIVKTPFSCGTKPEIVDHVAFRVTAIWPIGTEVQILNSRPGQYYIELPNGAKAWVGQHRVEPTELF